MQPIYTASARCGRPVVTARGRSSGPTSHVRRGPWLRACAPAGRRAPALSPLPRPRCMRSSYGSRKYPVHTGTRGIVHTRQPDTHMQRARWDVGSRERRAGAARAVSRRRHGRRTAKSLPFSVEVKCIHRLRLGDMVEVRWEGRLVKWVRAPAWDMARTGCTLERAGRSWAWEIAAPACTHGPERVPGAGLQTRRAHFRSRAGRQRRREHHAASPSISWKVRRPGGIRGAPGE
jgi:hypothetical protein